MPQGGAPDAPGRAARPTARGSAGRGEEAWAGRLTQVCGLCLRPPYAWARPPRVRAGQRGAAGVSEEAEYIEYQAEHIKYQAQHFERTP